MNAMIQRIADVLTQDAPHYVVFSCGWFVEGGKLGYFLNSYTEAEDRCEELNREWMVREIVKAMKAPVEAFDSIRTSAIHYTANEIWQMFIEAILNDN